MLKFPKLSIETIFDLYHHAELLPKLKELKYFCFLRGRLNSYVLDGDEIILHVSYKDRKDLLFKLKSLGVLLKTLLPGDEISYGKPWPECLNYPTPNNTFPDIAEPGKQRILDEEVFVFISKTYFTISIVNSDKEKWYVVNHAQIIAALKIENHLETLGLEKYVTDDGQREYGRFINRFHYPELF